MAEETKKKKAEEDPSVERDRDAWMDTLSDLIFLMITFFVLLISMSSMDVKALKQAFGFFDDAAGVLMFPEEEEGTPTFVARLTPLGQLNVKKDAKASDELPLNVYQNRAHKLLKGVADGLMKEADGDELFSTLKAVAESTAGEVQILRIKDGIEVMINGRLLFPHGDTELDDNGKKLLEDVAVILQLWGGEVEINALWSWHQGSEILAQVVAVMENKRVPGKWLHPHLYPGIDRKIRFILKQRSE